ncbi:hypothetical protein MNBD_GAMMA22-986 [hydrothermal vent metagenome]|uniref:Uncharacterized protein n=1 Tax=hydrothermal vent metagenome TaxID=652676 RepID=A0A3B1ALV5_9ZZZZ
MNKTSILILVFSVVSFIAGSFLSDWKSPEIANTVEKLPANTEPLSKKLDTYSCPMHPHVNQPQAGQCPICNMSLVKQTVTHTSSAILINPSVLHNFSIKTAVVKKGTMYRELLTYGYVNKIESVAEKIIAAPVSGKITFLVEKIADNETKQNELLLTIDSNAWKKLQQSYLTALDKKDVRQLRTITQQLSALNFKIKDIQQLKHTRVPTSLFNIYSDKRGIIKNLKIKLGQQVKKDSELFSLAPVYPIIGYAEVFEGQWRWLEAGHRAQMIIHSVPNISWQGQVLEVDDILMNRSRTIKTKLGFKAQDNVLLKAGMQANFTIFAAPKEQVVYVPQDAVIRTANKARVMLALGQGRFKAVNVKIGLEDGRRIEILEGVTEGMQVVSSGQFLLDSESQLRAELQRMQQ